MRHDILSKPEYAIVKAELDPGEVLVAESGAMATMSANMRIETGTRGGVVKAFKRSFLGKESFFINKYSPEGGAGKITLAPGCPGDIIHLNLDGTMTIQKGSYLASSDSVEIETGFQGITKGLFSREGFFLLKASGKGDLFLSSYGAIHEVQVDGSYKVDNGYIVAFEDSLTYNIQRIGNLKSFVLGGEALVCEFTGRGRLWIQTRSADEFAAWAHPFRRVKVENNNKN